MKRAWAPSPDTSTTAFLPIGPSFLIVSFWVGSLFGMAQLNQKRLFLSRWRLRVPVERKHGSAPQSPPFWLKVGFIAAFDRWLGVQIVAAAEADSHSP
jgi:hypothetical protein